MIGILLGLTRSRWLWIAVGVFTIITFAWMAVVSYGNSKWKAGQADANSEWLARMAEAQTNAAAAQEELNRLRVERDRLAQLAANARTVIVRETQQEIINAPDVESAYVAYTSARSRLRDTASADYLDARSAYLSSVGAE